MNLFRRQGLLSVLPIVTLSGHMLPSLQWLHCLPFLPIRAKTQLLQKLPFGLPGLSRAKVSEAQEVPASIHDYKTFIIIHNHS